jgi:hypothetical protein
VLSCGAVPLTIAENFIYFHRGAFPCLFVMEVEEGFAQLDVKDQRSLDILLAYCEGKMYTVNWAQAVENEPKNRRAYRNYPGGKYVASSVHGTPRES